MNEDNIISKRANELREKLRNARSQTFSDTSASSVTSTNNEPGSGQSEIGIDTSSSIVQRYSPISSTEDRGAELLKDTTTGRSNQSSKPDIRSLSGQNDRNNATRGTATKSQGGIFGSVRRSTQDDKRERPQFGRPSENNSTYRSDGIDISSGASSGKQPKRVGNLVRNEREEPNFTPPRFFGTPEYLKEDIIDIKQEREQERSNSNTSPEKTNQKRTVEGTETTRKRGRPRTKIDVKQPSEESENSQETTQHKNLKERIEEFVPRYGGNRLTEKEAANLQEPLSSALEDIFEQMDKFLMGYCNLTPIDEGGQPVWSDISEKEMKAFVKSWTALGQKSAIAAGAARGAVGLSDFIIGAAVLGPRIKKSGELIRQAHAEQKINQPERVKRHARTYSRQNI